MKRFLPALTLLGALAGTTTAAPYVLPSPQPGALTPYDWQPVYTIEGLYSFADKSELPDTGGVRGSLNLYDSAEGTYRHQFNINVAAAWGSDDTRVTRYLPPTAAELLHARAKLDLFLMPVTLGYNLNIELWDDVFLYLGGKAGYAWSHGKLKVSGITPEGIPYARSRSGDTGGFTFSVGAGVKIQCSEAIYVHAGYEFGRSFLELDLHGRDIIYGAHSIYLGVGSQF